MKKIFLSMLAVAAMASCSKTDVNKDAAAGDLVAVNFGGSVEMLSKAASAFDKAYVGTVGVADNADEWITDPADYTNVTLNIAADGSFTAGTTILVPAATYNFYSVATDHTALPTRTTDTYPLAFGLTTDAATTGGDIVYAASKAQAVSQSAKSVALKYDHVYGKVKFLVAAKIPGQFTTEELAAATISVTGFCTTGTLNVKTGAISDNTTYTGAVSTRDVEYYALPQKVSAKKLSVSVTIAGSTYTGEITDDAKGSIDANTLREITINVTGSGLNFTGTKEEWGTSTGDVDVQ